MSHSKAIMEQIRRMEEEMIKRNKEEEEEMTIQLWRNMRRGAEHMNSVSLPRSPMMNRASTSQLSQRPMSSFLFPEDVRRDLIHQQFEDSSSSIYQNELDIAFIQESPQTSNRNDQLSQSVFNLSPSTLGSPVLGRASTSRASETLTPLNVTPSVGAREEFRREVLIHQLQRTPQKIIERNDQSRHVAFRSPGGLETVYEFHCTVPIVKKIQPRRLATPRRRAQPRQLGQPTERRQQAQEELANDRNERARRSRSPVEKQVSKKRKPNKRN